MSDLIFFILFAVLETICTLGAVILVAITVKQWETLDWSDGPFYIIVAAIILLVGKIAMYAMYRGI